VKPKAMSEYKMSEYSDSNLLSRLDCIGIACGGSAHEVVHFAAIEHVDAAAPAHDSHFEVGARVLLAAQRESSACGIYEFRHDERGERGERGALRLFPTLRRVEPGTLVVAARSNAVFVATDDGFYNASCAIGPHVVCIKGEKGARLSRCDETVINATPEDEEGFQKMRVNAKQLSTRSWATDSDLTLKTDVRLIECALRTLERIRGYTFDWKDGSTARERERVPAYREYGLIAQEVEAAVPSAVARVGETLSVSYPALIPLLVEAVRDLAARVAKLEGAVARAPK
jgi:hypothetical protein